jgi:YD repeat-containing protein
MFFVIKDGRITEVLSDNNDMYIKFLYDDAGRLICKTDYSLEDKAILRHWNYIYKDSSIARIESFEGNMHLYDYHFSNGLLDSMEYCYNSNVTRFSYIKF